MNSQQSGVRPGPHGYSDESTPADDQMRAETEREAEERREATEANEQLDAALADTFPASDPVSNVITGLGMPSRATDLAPSGDDLPETVRADADMSRAGGSAEDLPSEEAIDEVYREGNVVDDLRDSDDDIAQDAVNGIPARN
jgi:hypothetical protein